MKNSLWILAAAVLLSLEPLASAQSVVDDLRTSNKIETWTDADLPSYSIQIAATQSVPADASFAKGLETVYEYSAPEGLLKYYFGKFSTYVEANKALQSVRRKGFKEAFIVNLRGGGKAKVGASTGGKIVTTGRKPIEIDPNLDYVIQVGAYRYPLYISFFENVGEVYEYRLNDKIFRYTTKPVKGSEVASELARVKSLGYDAAFVVEFSLYQPYKID